MIHEVVPVGDLVEGSGGSNKLALEAGDGLFKNGIHSIAREDIVSGEHVAHRQTDKPVDYH